MPETRTIQLSKGLVALVDEADYEFLNQWKWHASKAKGSQYAAKTTLASEGAPRRYVRMHNILLPTPEGFYPDHINGDGLDNRRANLRVATWVQNTFNGRQQIGVSGFRGVWKNGNRWAAYIKDGCERKYIGAYSTPLEAAIEYDRVAITLRGEFARPNFPMDRGHQ